MAKTVGKISRIVNLREAAKQALKNGNLDKDLVAIVKNWLERTPEIKELPTLTSRQIEIFNFILEGMRIQRTPSVREIGSQFGIKSPNGVMCHLRALERKGVITRFERISRGIQIPECYAQEADV